MPKLRKALKKGVTIEVIAGKEKGKTGKIVHIVPKKQRVIVEKLNMQKRHSKPNAQSKHGGIVDKEGSIAISNVKVVADIEPEKPAKKSKKKAAKGK